MIDCHKLSGLKQHRFIILQLGRSEVQDEPHWAKIKVFAGLSPPRNTEGESTFLPFLASMHYSNL